MKRICKRCGKEKNLEEFSLYGGKKNGNQRRLVCSVCLNRQKRDRRRQHRGDVLAHYGGSPPQCACCGEDRDEFLCIDHMNGGGVQHRQQVGSDIYPWLRMENYPEGFRVLCHNCNMAHGLYGHCPHSLEKVAG